MRPRLGAWRGQLRIERYEHAEDSGGLGRYRGGIGIQAADYRNLSGDSGKNSGVLCGSEQRRDWLKDRVEGQRRQVGLVPEPLS